ncbi:hypothetical protein CP533_6319 [Ophiocordyceps camponoti-saundersi (nom. inval.)]|nr:hypothetical protein CP533_6319 [Ophiocordyceps camponoti-saundersi (nom. inval.)]
MEDASSSLSESISRIELSEPGLFSRTSPETFDKDTPRHPYMTFTTIPGKSQHLVVRIWSHDQGFCNPDLVDPLDVYANSCTWFAFGRLRSTDIGGTRQISDEDLHIFQSNVLASRSLYCHTNEWKIGMPAEADGHDDTSPLTQFLDSFPKGSSQEIGVFPLAKYPYWENVLWKMEVQIKNCDDEDDGWQTGCHGETTLRLSRTHRATRRSVGPEEKNSLRRQFNPDEATAKTVIDLISWEIAQKQEHPEALSTEDIMKLRQDIDSIPVNHPMRPMFLANLAIILARRSRSLGTLEYLNQAISMMREAVASIPLGEPFRDTCSNNLGLMLVVRFERVGDVKDPEESVELMRQMLARNPPASPSRVTTMVVLADALRQRSSRLADKRGLREAIAVCREAIATAAPGEPDDDGEGFFPTLMKCLAAYNDLTGEAAHLDEAIQLAREVIAATRDDAIRMNLTLDLGLYLDRRFSQKQAAEDREESAECFRLVVQSSETSPLMDRIVAGRHLLSRPETLQLGNESYDIANYVVPLVSQLATLRANPADHAFNLSSSMGIASDAAAIALHHGEESTAAIFLERGRAIIAGRLHFLRTEADTTELRKHHPELAGSFETLRQRLVTLKSKEMVETAGSTFASSSIDRRELDENQLRELLLLIRKKDGLDGFGSTCIPDDMCRAAAQGPVVALNVSVHRCDAIIVQESGVSAVRLPNLCQEAIRERTADVQSARTLEWLWDVIVDPVLDALGFTSVPTGDFGQWPHIWWIPTGSLTRFPIHAAGYHLEAGNRTALDRVVSSYCSSIRAIILTRLRRVWEPTTDGSVAVISMKDTPGLDPLANTVDEISVVRELCASDPLNLSIVSPKPYRDEAITALKSCGIFHFAGHGHAAENPLESLLYLEDWNSNPLTVMDLIETDLGISPPFLAYLSACGTGKNTDNKSADESLHLTGMFQLTGFRHVIGTLWEVDDHLCVDMARKVYESLGERGLNDTSVGISLHRATRALREEWLDSEMTEARKRGRDVALVPEAFYKAPLWVPYIHFGV